MAVSSTESATDSTAVERNLRLLTIDDLEKMVRLGIIGRDERVELIGGQIVRMSATGRRHTWTVIRLCRVFNRRDDVLVSPQSTLEIQEGIGPEPDIAVIRADADPMHRVSARTALLVIEVADTSLAHDRYTKAPLYAQAGIPEYWIVDLNGDRIEVYREPSEAGYRLSRLHLRGESLSPLFAPDLTVDVDAVLGPPEEA